MFNFKLKFRLGKCQQNVGKMLTKCPRKFPENVRKISGKSHGILFALTAGHPVVVECL